MNSNKTISLQGNHIILEFPYSAGMVDRVKALPDRKYDPGTHTWTLPASSFHADIASRFGVQHQFLIRPEIMGLLQKKMSMKNTFKDIRLYPYQAKAVEFFMDADGRALCGDDMGMGKTIEALVYMNTILIKPALVVCPASVLYKWEAEIKKWTPYTCAIITQRKSELPDVDIWIMSYDIMSSKADELRKHNFGIIIADECHRITNPKALRTKTMLALKENRFIGLSGTPFLNRPIELFPILQKIQPQEWSDWWSFARRYCDAHQIECWIKTGGRPEKKIIWDTKGISNPEELKARLQSIYIRREKKEVMKDLPDLTRDIIPMVTSMSAYLRYEQELLKMGEPLAVVTKLHQHIGELKQETVFSLACDILSNVDNKLVIFAHYKNTVEWYMSRLMAEGYTVDKIVGSTSSKERYSIVQNFLGEDDPVCVIVSEAGNEGIDLYRASYGIVAERAWNPGKEEQFEGRLHRQGQKNAVTIYYPVITGTFDEDHHMLIEQKREVFKTLMGGSDVTTNIQNELFRKLKGA